MGMRTPYGSAAVLSGSARMGKSALSDSANSLFFCAVSVLTAK
jgi:hypothetical protein